MTTVDDAVEAGARAIYDPGEGTSHEYRVDVPDWVPYCICGWKASGPHAVEEYDRHVSRLVLREAWPILSAPLRKLNTGDNRALYGNDFEAGMAKALWLVKTEIDRIDKGLGLT